jgi:hypothetical protein
VTAHNTTQHTFSNTQRNNSLQQDNEQQQQQQQQKQKQKQQQQEQHRRSGRLISLDAMNLHTVVRQVGGVPSQQPQHIK